MAELAENAASYAVPSGRAVRGRLAVPSSKSVTHRCFNLALLAGRPGVPVTVERPLLAEDTRLFLAALGRCGFQVEERGGEVRLTAGAPPAPSTAGFVGAADAANAANAASGPGAARLELTEDTEVEIFCGNAGTMLRFLVASLTAVPGTWRLDGTPRLRERPVGPLVEALRRLGARIDWLGREGCPPLRIAGGTLGAGTTVLDAGESSQYLSALLMAALRAPGPVTVEVEALTSAPYVEVTLACVAEAGGRIERLGPGTFRVEPGGLAPGRLRVEGDWSAACYPAAAAALTGGTVVLEGLARNSRQGDRRFLDLLAEMGAEVEWSGGAGGGETVEVRGPRASALSPDTASGSPSGTRRVAATGRTGAGGMGDAGPGESAGWISGGGTDDAGPGEAVSRIAASGRAFSGLAGLTAITADLSGMPDQVPTLAALAPFARGVTRIENVAHLRIKESDRLAAMAGELRRLGAEVEEGPDRLVIPGIWHGQVVPRSSPGLPPIQGATGPSGQGATDMPGTSAPGTPPPPESFFPPEPFLSAPPGSPAPVPIPTDPVEVATHGDHRIAMALALVGLRRPGVRVAAPEVVGKSYPAFWRDLESLLPAQVPALQPD